MLVSYPLRRVLSRSLEKPSLLQFGTRALSHFPRLFNWMLKFAQSHGIVMAAEEPETVIDEVQSVSELSPEARALFEALELAFRNSPGKNR
jgi:hypothetical protein